MEGPQHEDARIRTAALLRGRTAAITKQVEQIWIRAWKSLEADTSIDLLEGMIFPCVTDAFQCLLGCPDEIAVSLRNWSTVFNNSMSGLSSDEEYLAAERAMRELLDVIDGQATMPWVDALFFQQPFEPAERKSTLILLLLAGFDTSVDMLSNCILHAIEKGESVRQDSPERLIQQVCPVNFTMREAVGECAIESSSVSQGERVLISWAGGNHALNSNESEKKGGFAFGYGPHSCLGRGMALMQLDACISGWADAGCLLSLSGAVRFNDNACFYRPLSMPVRVSSPS